MVAKTRKPASWMDPQARHDQAFMAPKPDKIADRTTLEASLKKKNGPSMEPPLPSKPSADTEANNAYASAHDATVMVRLMRNNPGRSFEDVEKMARAAGMLGYDPIAQAMKDHPSLTRENAEEIAKAFGF